jgi:hypothetical protein
MQKDMIALSVQCTNKYSTSLETVSMTAFTNAHSLKEFALRREEEAISRARQANARSYENARVSETRPALYFLTVALFVNMIS